MIQGISENRADESGSYRLPIEKFSTGLNSDTQTALHAFQGLSRKPWANTARVAVLLISDTLSILLAASLAYFSWAGAVLQQHPSIYLDLAPLTVLFPLAYALWRLYPGFGFGAVETLRRLSLASTLIYFSLAFVCFALKVPHQYSRITFGIAVVFTIMLVPLSRYLMLLVFRRSTWWPQPCAVFGTGALARRTILSLRSAFSLGYQPIAVLAEENSKKKEVAQVPVIGKIDDLALIAQARCRVAIVAPQDPLKRDEILRTIEPLFSHVILLQNRYDNPIEGVELRNFGGVIGMEFVNQLLLLRNRFLKRGLDLVLGTLILIASLPLIALAILLIRCFSRGSAFYRQERVGLGGVNFYLWKLRTMYSDAEEKLQSHLDSNSEAEAQWGLRFKLENDPRVIPRIGTFLRRFSVDELPQLWNVVTGKMSLVGPRPFPGYHLKSFSTDFRSLRTRVRPGLSGLWQVMSRAEGTTADQEAFDTYYIRNWSIWMDLYILAKTASAVLSGRGAR